MDYLIKNLTCNASYWCRDRYSGYEDEVFCPDYEEYINIFDDEDERDEL